MSKTFLFEKKNYENNNFDCVFHACPCEAEFFVYFSLFKLRVFIDLFYLVNCWPNDNGSNCEVNVEYELVNTKLELREVQIEIPIP